MKQRLVFAVMIGAVLAVGAQRARGQNVNGTIVGTITDVAGAAIPDASVTITNVNTDVIRTFQTDASGYYSSPDLAPGTYRVSASKSGFTTTAQTGITLFVNTTVRVNLGLTPGSVSETVNVTGASATALQTDTADTGREIDTKQVASLPLGSVHNFQGLLNTVPGAAVATSQHSSFYNAQGSLASPVNGSSSLNNTFDIEGIDDNQRTNMLQIYIPSIEAIQEVNITTSNYDPQQGSALGAVTNVILKSGTNQFHGEAYEFYTGNALDSRSYFQQGANGGPFHYPHIVDNYFGGNVGGPIQKGKTFFFVSLVKHAQRTGETYNLSVATPDIRAGNFSNPALSPIYDPQTGDTQDCLPGGNTKLCGTGRTQFPGNIIPADRLSPIALKLLTYVPLPNNNLNASGTASYQNNYITSSNFGQDTPDLDVKIDRYFGQNDHLSGRFSYEDPQLNQPGIFPGEVGGPLTNGGIGGVEGNGTEKTFSTGINWVHGFSTTFLSEVRVGLSRFHNLAHGTGYGMDLASQAGIPGANVNDYTSGMSEIMGEGFSDPMLGTSNTIQNRAGTIIELFDNWSKVYGNHTFEWGADYRRVRDDLLLGQGSAGVFTFTAGPTSLNGGKLPTSFANDFAGFLLDVPNSTSRVYDNVFPAYRQNDLFLYAGDKWQVSQKLTLTYGLRWEYYGPPTPHFAGGFSNYIPSNNTLEEAGVGTVPRNLGLQADFANFNPRLGIAYRVTPNSVVRIGFGMSTMAFPVDLYAYSYPLEPTESFSSLSSYGPGILSDGTPTSFARGFPAIQPYIPPTNGIIQVNTPLLLNQSYTAINLQWRNPYVESWNLAYQRNLPRGWIVDVAYVGNHAVHTPLENNLNAATSYGQGALGQPEYVAFGRTAATTSYFQMYNSSYDALQAKLDHRFAHDFSVTTSWTYAKAIGYESFSGDYVSALQDYVNPRRDYAVTDFNQKFLLNQTFTWNLPIGEHRKLLNQGITGKILGGFELTGISGFGTGFPLNFNCTCAAFNTPGNRAFPNINGNLQKLYGIQTKPWFNTASFSVPAAGTQGDVGNYISSGPDYFNLDASLFRRLRLSERLNLELRTEWFHATNTPQFGLPNTQLGSSSFGLVTTANGARTIDVAGKLTF